MRDSLLPLIGIVVGILSSYTLDLAPENRESNVPSTNNEAERDRALSPTAEDTNFVVEVVEKVEPAVVQINTSQTVKTQLPEVYNHPFFRRFFGENLPTQPTEKIVRGLGSGFVINSNGQILTNAHVVSNAERQ
jgi:S1-C subfamily serine protease